MADDLQLGPKVLYMLNILYCRVSHTCTHVHMHTHPNCI